MPFHSGFAETAMIDWHQSGERMTHRPLPPIANLDRSPYNPVVNTMTQRGPAVISPQMEFKDKYFSLLEKGAKPGRYIGGEPNMVLKDFGPRAGSLRARVS